MFLESFKEESFNNAESSFAFNFCVAVGFNKFELRDDIAGSSNGFTVKNANTDIYRQVTISDNPYGTVNIAVIYDEER